MPKVKVEQDPEVPVPTSIIATSILEISEGVKKLLNSGLKRDAVVILVQAHSKVTKTDILKVLDSLEALGDIYLNKKKTQ